MWKDKLKSRKLWVTVLYAIFVFVNEFFGIGLDDADLTRFAAVVVGYVLSQGMVDSMLTEKK
jgi:uncharacterized membrane protein